MKSYIRRIAVAPWLGIFVLPALTPSAQPQTPPLWYYGCPQGSISQIPGNIPNPGKPVTFRYKHEIDLKGIPQFGLVAEEVEKVNPDLVVRDKEGKPYSVRYDQVNAMLLNEFLNEHRTVQELKTEIAALTTTVKEQA